MSSAETATSIFVGHRGFPQKYPENSFIGIKAALDLGARAIELDIQASADGEPMVCHDVNLKRVAGLSEGIGAYTAEELMQISVHEPRRFQEQFNPCPMSHLEQIVALVASYEGAVLFVELKEEIFTRYARDAFVRKVLPMLTPLKGLVFIISFDLACLRIVQDLNAARVGWVISKYNEASEILLRQRPVDVVISDVRKLPALPTPLWRGEWQWFIYDVIDPRSIAGWRERGIRYIETWDIETLMDAARADL